MNLTDKQLHDLKNHIYIGNTIYSWFLKNEIPAIKPSECLKQLGDKFGYENINRILLRVRTQLSNEEKGKDTLSKTMDYGEFHIIKAISEAECEEDCVLIAGILEHFMIMNNIKKEIFEE